jgi:hypothetical protein
MATDLQQHKFVMRHIDGTANVLCDYISRAEYSSPQEVERIRKHSLLGSDVAPQTAPSRTAQPSPVAGGSSRVSPPKNSKFFSTEIKIRFSGNRLFITFG